MRGNNVMGLLFSNMHEESIRELTDRRTMASVPIGGRYRMIDFYAEQYGELRNQPGRGNYQTELSIPDGSPGNRKGVGSFQKNATVCSFCRPLERAAGIFSNRIEILHANMGFLTNCKEEYVLLSDCDAIFNMDFKRVIAEHIKNEADVTLIYRWGRLPKTATKPWCFP